MGLPSRIRAVVTGGGSGLGRALCLEIARRGGTVVVADVSLEGSEETVSLIERAGGEAWPVVCDVSDYDQVYALYEAAVDRMGATDLLVNNAGVACGGPIEGVPIEDWRWVVGINLWGVIHGCHVFVPHMKERGAGFVLNIASAAGLLSPPDLSPYNVTKAGVVALSESLAAECADAGVVVTVACPTFFTTNLLETARGPEEMQEVLRERVQKLMARSRVQAPEVARACLAALERGDLYAVPMRDGRIFWRIKRAAPGRFPRFLAYARKAMEGLQGR